MNILTHDDAVSLSEGGGGKEMQDLIQQIRNLLPKTGEWSNTGDDSAALKIEGKSGKLCFTSDSYVVTPLFFPGGNIGKIAFCGTVNDLAVMGAKPLGISLSLIIEEGFPKKDLFLIVKTIADLSEKTGIPVVTGDTKVMEKGNIDGLAINTAGVGVTDRILDEALKEGDRIIVSGSIGKHGAALLAARFGIKSDILTDSRPLLKEIESVRGWILQAKDVTRGGLAAVLNEVAEKNGVRIVVDEERIPVDAGTSALSRMLGIEPYVLACEGTFVCFSRREHSERVVAALRKFNSEAAVIGEVAGKGDQSVGRVFMKTRIGTRVLPNPSGRIVPRIC
ncbi:hydrogenase expression/formation protein HypE [Candidatus Woesearchaeota archaeon]|nr:MAG: hydrogenase expression/formation protein HypE [Candidatus Woesearchaeota archaeon]